MKHAITCATNNFTSTLYEKKISVAGVSTHLRCSDFVIRLLKHCFVIVYACASQNFFSKIATKSSTFNWFTVFKKVRRKNVLSVLTSTVTIKCNFSEKWKVSTKQ